MTLPDVMLSISFLQSLLMINSIFFAVDEQQLRAPEIEASQSGFLGNLTVKLLFPTDRSSTFHAMPSVCVPVRPTPPFFIEFPGKQLCGKSAWHSGNSPA